MVNIFNLVLYQPLLNFLILLYEYIPGHDFGLAVIVLTVFIRFLIYPLGIKAIQSQKSLQELQPKIQEIQKEYGNNKEKQSQALMEFYKKEKINPFSGCLPLLIQFPILIALYQVFMKGFRPEELLKLYNFVPNPGEISPLFLGLVNLSQPNIILAVLAGIVQFFQMKMITPQQLAEGQASKKQKTDQMSQFANMMQKQMLYFFPIFTVFILWQLPSAIGLYWVVTALFSVGQQYFIFKPSTKAKLGTG